MLDRCAKCVSVECAIRLPLGHGGEGGGQGLELPLEFDGEARLPGADAMGKDLVLYRLVTAGADGEPEATV